MPLAVRILVIDDEELVRLTLRQTLEKAGYEVAEAQDGKEGLEIQNEVPVDLVITDIIMPEMDGMEMIHALRQKHPDVKVIAISGGGRAGTAGYLNLAKKIGAHHVLPKPFDRQELLQLVKTTLASDA